MFRFGARLMSVGSETLMKNVVTGTNIYSSRFIQSSAQPTILDNVRSMNVSNSRIGSLITYIQELGFNEDEIKLAIQNQPELLNKPSVAWNSILGSLLHYGMKKENILSILEKWPHVLSLKKPELDKNIEAWFRCNLGDELTINLLQTHPSFLQVHHATLEKRIKQYQVYFESKKGVAKLLLLAPNVLDEDWDELLDKLNYLDELCIEKSYVLSSGVLAHTIQHIMARHEFLIRAGIYKKPGKDYNKKLCKNPKLTDIVNLSDEKFVSKVARLSLLEYEVFLDIFEKEYEESKKQGLDFYDDDDHDEELNKLSYAKHHKSARRH